MQDHQILQTGVDYYRAKEFQRAEEVFRSLIANSPHYAEPYHLLGVILHDQGKIDAAIEAMERAVNLGLNDARCFLNLSVMLKDKGQLEPAERMCRQSLEVAPSDPAAHFHLAVIQRALNQKKAALSTFRKVLEINPNHPDTHLALGNLFYSMEDWDQAEEEYRLELEANPYNEAARINFASMEVARKRIAAARRLYSEIPNDNVHYSRAQTALAELERTDGNLETAVEHHQRALACEKNVAADKISYAVTLQQAGRTQDSLDLLATVAREYHQDADTLSSICVHYFKMDHVPDAIRVLDDIVRLPVLSPLVRTNAGIIYLTVKDYRKGWPLFASRIELIDKYANFPLDKGRRWTGQDLTGKTLILVEEQGLGDTIQFVRFAAHVKERFQCQVWFSGTTKLMGFMRSVAGVDRWMAQVSPQDHYDFWCPLPDLPWLLGMNDESEFPSPVWYIRAEAERVDTWRRRLDELANSTDLRVGISWQGSKKYKGDHTRSYPLEAMRPLFSLPGIRWFSLQKGDGEQQLATLADVDLVDLGREIDQDGNAFVDTAAVVEQLDLVISCDSSLAHLAGAHGTPVWLALGLEPDWRWGLSGDSTCWYPATRLFRRSRTDSWPDVFSRMSSELEGLKHNRRTGHARPQPEQSVDEVRARAIKLHAEGLLDHAEGLYREVLCRLGRDAIATKQLAMIYAQTGRSSDSEKLLRAALDTHPEDASLHFYLGQILRLLQREDEALKSLVRASELDPKLPLLWTELAKLHQQLNNIDAVIRSLEQAVEHTPDDVKTRLSLGDQLWRLQRIEEAAEQFEQAHRLEPANAAHLASLAICWIGLARTDEAIDAFRKALELNPRNTLALANLGATLYNRRDYAQAKELAERALEVDPKQSTALATLGLICKQQDRHEEACGYFIKAYQYDPHRPETKLMYAWTMHVQGDPAEAKRLHEEIERSPNLDATTLNALGNYYRQLGKYDRALDLYQRAVARNSASATISESIESRIGKPDLQATVSTTHANVEPSQLDALLNLGLVYLAQGDFARGWPYYCQREGILPYYQSHYPEQRWRGENLDGKTILIVAEQGLGDTLQFVRFAKALKQRYQCRIVFFTHKPIVPLLRQVPEIDVLITELPTCEELDCWVYMMSLPYLLSMYDEQDFYVQSPYLSAEPARVEYWKDRLKDLPGLKIGLAWKGSKAYVLDRLRSLPLSAFQPLANIPGVSFVSLLRHSPEEEQELLASPLKVHSLGNQLDADGAFLDTAAVIQNLDLVITCDTSLAHLAGALGKDFWVALSVASDWRWMLERSHSTWYPSATLFRQRQPRNWDDVVCEMASTLRTKLNRIRSIQFERPSASVVIPCYNGAEFIQTAIESALQQKVLTEVIVVDDGSTDDSVQKVTEIIKNSGGLVSLLSQKNRGAAAARNAGLRLARAKYVAFLDADDTLGSEFMSMGIKFLQDNPSFPAVAFQVELLDAYRPINDWQKKCIEGSLPGNMLLRTDCVNRMGGFPEDNAFRGRAAGEDIIFRRQLRIFGQLPMICNTQYNYRVRRGSHLDFFLDRAYMHEGKTRVRYYTPEEKSGELDRAEVRFQWQVADRISQETRDKLVQALGILTDYIQHGKAIAPDDKVTGSFEDYLVYWLAQQWPLDGAIVGLGPIPWSLTRSVVLGNAKSRRGESYLAGELRAAGTAVEEPEKLATGIQSTTLENWELRADKCIRMIVSHTGERAANEVFEELGKWARHLADRGVIIVHGSPPRHTELESLTWLRGFRVNCFLDSPHMLLFEISKPPAM